MAEQANPLQAQGQGVDLPLPARRWGELGSPGCIKIVILGTLLGFVFRHEIAQTVHLWLTDPN